MKFRRLAISLGITVFLLGLVAATSASALGIPLSLAIDFRNAEWNVSNEIKFEIDNYYGSIDVEAEADTNGAGGILSWDSNFGLGIVGTGTTDPNPKVDGDDNSSNEQEFKVNFYGGEVMFGGLWLTGFEGLLSDLELEIDGSGKSLNNRLFKYNSDVFISLAGFGKFDDLDIEGKDPRTKFYVAGFDENSKPGAVSEPATMLLLGIGLIGLAGLGRKKVLKRNTD